MAARRARRIAAWYATYFAGFVVFTSVERYACPEPVLFAGRCPDYDVWQILEGIMVFFIALSAVAVVTATAAVAPSRRAAVAWAAFAVGAMVAVHLALETEMYRAGALAIGVGLVTAVWVARRAARGGAVPAAGSLINPF